MSISRRKLLQSTGLFGLAAALPGLVRGQLIPPETPSLTIAVGGRSLLSHLPLSVAHLLGYFEEENLDIEVEDHPDGPAAVEAATTGQADIVSGAFEHTIMLQAKGQAFRSFVLQGRAPMAVLAVSRRTMPDYQSPADLKGRQIGVAAPGATTSTLASFYLGNHGLAADDVSFVELGTGEQALAAVRSGSVDAIAGIDPVISALLRDDAVRVLADTRTLDNTRQVFNGNMPAACLFAAQSFIDGNPITVQSLANAIVRAEKWLQSASAQQVIELVPESFLDGDADMYRRVLDSNHEAFSPDGMLPEDGPQTALRALTEFRPDFDRTKINVSLVWTNQFAFRANQDYPQA